MNSSSVYTYIRQCYTWSCEYVAHACINGKNKFWSVEKYVCICVISVSAKAGKMSEELPAAEFFIRKMTIQPLLEK